jgi:hypothetical protein
MTDTSNEIAGLLLDNVRNSYCFPCLAGKLGISEKQARDSAQPLVVRSGFRITRAHCADCRAESELLQTPQLDRWSP